MPPRRGGLGRGLDALFGPVTSRTFTPADGEQPDQPGASPAARAEAAASTPSERPHAPLEVEIGRIEPNPRQPRRQMDPDHLAALAGSIREHGLLQPLVVTQLEVRIEGGEPGRTRYQLIAGERRWQAAKMAGLIRVPVVVREASGRDLLELALVENVQRADLNPLEEASAYQQLASEFGLTQEQIGQRVGKSKSTVANTMRLLHLPAMVQQAVVDGLLTEGHARAILQAGDAETQRLLAREVLERGLSVRQTEELARRMQTPQESASEATPEEASQTRSEVEEVEARFREILGTKVNVTRSRKGGRLVIHYYDDEQLQGIYDRLAGQP
jgi:ParB family transcriptional regulator, chromosome partitioning protein